MLPGTAEYLQLRGADEDYNLSPNTLLSEL